MDEPPRGSCGAVRRDDYRIVPNLRPPPNYRPPYVFQQKQQKISKSFFS